MRENATHTRRARHLHDGAGLEPVLQPNRLFDAACHHGFRCIDGSDDYGAIAPGARADLVVLDYAVLCEDFLTPEHDEVDVLLTRATSRHVRELVVAGRRVVGHGVLFGLDLPDAERELMACARRAAPSMPGNGPATDDGASQSAPTLQASTTSTTAACSRTLATAAGRVVYQFDSARLA